MKNCCIPAAGRCVPIRRMALAGKRLTFHNSVMSAQDILAFAASIRASNLPLSLPEVVHEHRR
jgi:hypothetical protein